MNDLYAHEWSQFTNHFKPTFKLLKRDKQGSKSVRIDPCGKPLLLRAENHLHPLSARRS